jgi:hypothetical protein
LLSPKLSPIGANLPQTGLNCYEFIKKRWNTNIDFSGVKGLLRLARRHVLRRETRGQAAQKEGAKAQDGLAERTNCVSSIHKSNYTQGEKLLQQIFLRNLGCLGKRG